MATNRRQRLDGLPNGLKDRPGHSQGWPGHSPVVIYLRHPVYGEKVATSQVEVDFDVSNGWEVFDPIAPPPPPENNLATKRKRKE